MGHSGIPKSRLAVTGHQVKMMYHGTYSDCCLNRNERPRESGFHPAAIPALTAGISAEIRSARFGERFRPNTENGKSMTSSRVLPGCRDTEMEMPLIPTPES